MANIPTVGNFNDVIVRFRAQAADLRSRMKEIQEDTARMRLGVKGFNAEGLGTLTLFRNMGIGLKGIVGIAALAFATKQLSELASMGAKFNVELEGMVLGMKAVVAANITATDATGKQLEGTEKLAVAQKLVNEQVEKMKTDALLTVATLQQIVQSMQAAIPPAMAAGLTLDQTRQIMVAIVQAAGAIALPMQQVDVEVREILSGTMNMHTRLRGVLGITNEQIKNWKDQNILFDQLMKKMASFVAAGQEAGDSFKGVTSSLRDFQEQLTGKAMKPAMELIRQSLLGLRDWMGQVQGGVFVFRKEVVDGLTTAKDITTAFIREGLALVKVLTEAAGVAKNLVSFFLTASAATGGVLALAAAVALLSKMAIAATGAATALEGTLMLLAAHPVGATIAAMVAGYIALRSVMNSLGPTLDQQIERSRESVKALEEERSATLNRVDDLKKLSDTVADTSQKEGDLRKELLSWVAIYPALEPLLKGEALNRAEIVRVIEQQIAKEKELAKVKGGDIKKGLEDERTMLQQRLKTWGDFYKELEAQGSNWSKARLLMEELGLRAIIAGSGEVEQVIRTRRIRILKQMQEDLARLEAIKKEQKAIEAPEEIKPVKPPETEQERKRRYALEDAEREADLKRETMKADLDLGESERARRLEQIKSFADLVAMHKLERDAIVEKADIEQRRIQATIDSQLKEREQLEARLKETNEGKDKLIKLDADIEANRQKLGENEKNRQVALAELDKKQKEEARQREDQLFEHRKTLGQASLREEIDRLQQIALDENRSAQDRMKARESLAQMSRKLEEDLFGHLRAIGEASAQDEINRLRRIADDTKRTAEERMKAAQAVYDKELELKQKREQAALGILGAVEEAGAGGIFTAEDLAREQARLLDEQQRRFQELARPGAALNLDEWRELIELSKQLRENILQTRDIGGVADIFKDIQGGALPPMLQALLGGGALPGAGAIKSLADALGLPTLGAQAQQAFGQVTSVYQDFLATMEGSASRSAARIVDIMADQFIERIKRQILAELSRT